MRLPSGDPALGADHTDICRSPAPHSIRFGVGTHPLMVLAWVPDSNRIVCPAPISAAEAPSRSHSARHCARQWASTVQPQSFIGVWRAGGYSGKPLWGLTEEPIASAKGDEEGQKSRRSATCTHTQHCRYAQWTIWVQVARRGGCDSRVNMP